MSYKVAKTEQAMLFALIKAHNELKLSLVSTEVHADITSLTTGDYRDPVRTPDLVTAANATTTPTAVALVNQLLHKLENHFADTLAHALADAAIDEEECTDEATAITLVNILHTAYEAHRVAGSDDENVHYTDDSTNTDASSTATNTGTLYTRANALKVAYNAHIIAASAGAFVEVAEV